MGFFQLYIYLMIFVFFGTLLVAPFIIAFYLFYRFLHRNDNNIFIPKKKPFSFKPATANEIGSYGEHLTLDIINKLNIHKKIFTNLYIPNNGKTAEIDLVLVTLKGIYVIESKNFSGWIYGHQVERFWTQTLTNGTKNKFYNPIMQNINHINALKKHFEEFPKLRYISYIVFSERCVLKNVTYDHDHVHVLNRNFLFKHIDNSIEFRDYCMTIDEYDSVCNMLETFCNVSEEVKVAHVDNIKCIINNQ